MHKNADQHTDQSALIAALRGTTRRLDNENAILRDALQRISEDARAGHSVRHIAAETLKEADALKLNDATIGTLDTILEHGSHAWHALNNEVDGAWPPTPAQYRVGSADYHLAAMLQYTKQLYDASTQTPPPRSAQGGREEETR